MASYTEKLHEQTDKYLDANILKKKLISDEVRKKIKVITENFNVMNI